MARKRARCRKEPVFPLAGDEGIERQPGEIVAGQEALGGEIAVGIEVRAIRGLALFENGDLVARLHLRGLDLLAIRPRQAGDHRTSALASISWLRAE